MFGRLAEFVMELLALKYFVCYQCLTYACEMRFLQQFLNSSNCFASACNASLRRKKEPDDESGLFQELEPEHHVAIRWQRTKTSQKRVISTQLATHIGVSGQTDRSLCLFVLQSSSVRRTCEGVKVLLHAVLVWA